MRKALVVVAVLLLAGCSSSSSSDGGAVLGCGEMREFARDVNAKVVLRSEYRARAKKVYDKGVLAHNTRIARASTELLAAFTEGVESRMAAAVAEMDAACKAAGL